MKTDFLNCNKRHQFVYSFGLLQGFFVLMSTIVIIISLTSCSFAKIGTQYVNDQEKVIVKDFLIESYNMGNYGKDFYEKTPVLSVSDAEVMLLGLQTFIPYDENNIIVIVAEVLDVPDEVAVGGYVGECSYRHKKICMYDIKENKLTELIKINEGYVTKLKLHSGDILEYHCGSLMYGETICLYDIINKKQHMVCTYEPMEFDYISNDSVNIFNNGDFYYIRFNQEMENQQVWKYSINDKINEMIRGNGIPCVYNSKVYLKTLDHDILQFSDIQTQKHNFEITSDNDLYSVYKSDFNEYYDKVILNNAENRIYYLYEDHIVEYTGYSDELTDTQRVCFYTKQGLYLYFIQNDSNSDVCWDYILI